MTRSFGLPTGTWQKDSLADNIIYSDHRTWRNQAGTVLEASFLLDSYQSSSRFYAHYQKKQSPILHKCELYELQQWATWQDKPIGIVVAGMLWGQLVTFLFKCKYYFTSWKPYLVLLIGPIIVIRQTISSMWERTTDTLQSGHNIKLISNDLSLYT